MERTGPQGGMQVETSTPRMTAERAFDVQTQGPDVHRLRQRCAPSAAASEVVVCHGGGVRRVDRVGALALLPMTAIGHMSRSLYDTLDVTLALIDDWRSRG